MTTTIRHVDFTLIGWKGDPGGPKGAERVTMRGCLEYPAGTDINEGAVDDAVVGMARRHREDLPAEFWDQPLELDWTVEDMDL